MIDQRVYFRIVSFFFFILYFSGLLKISKKFKMHYFVSNLVRKGDTIIDIGANLGYYTRIFAKATGSEGIVYAVEPVPLYREILKKNLAGTLNIIILPYALGDKQSVEYMGIPGNQPYRHGLTRIISPDEKEDRINLRVEVRTPSSLFSNLDKVDYIKCDIEGYENRVIPGFIEIIRHHRPILQIELESGNRALINDMLFKEGYLAYIPFKKGLRRISISEKYNDDIIFIHRDRQDFLRDLIIN
ncbi:MAG: FkbM family methyltransferase [Bacteroidales bacterium]|nr:FkbM family methyltransferase [Bacteroidales bacterium]